MKAEVKEETTKDKMDKEERDGGASPCQVCVSIVVTRAVVAATRSPSPTKHGTFSSWPSPHPI